MSAERENADRHEIRLKTLAAAVARDYDRILVEQLFVLFSPSTSMSDGSTCARARLQSND